MQYWKDKARKNFRILEVLKTQVLMSVYYWFLGVIPSTETCVANPKRGHLTGSLRKLLWNEKIPKTGIFPIVLKIPGNFHLKSPWLHARILAGIYSGIFSGIFGNIAGSIKISVDSKTLMIIFLCGNARNGKIFKRMQPFSPGKSAS